MVSNIVLNVLHDNSGQNIVVEQSAGDKTTASQNSQEKPPKARATRITKLEQVVCPVCGKGHMIKGKSAFGCSQWAQGCHTALPFTQYPDSLTPSKLNKLIKKNYKTQASDE